MKREYVAVDHLLNLYHTVIELKLASVDQKENVILIADDVNQR